MIYLRPLIGGPYIDLFSSSFGNRSYSNVHSCDVDLCALRAFVKQKTRVVFSVGQPLGSYSSWPLFALMHHYWLGVDGSRYSIPREKVH